MMKGIRVTGRAGRLLFLGSLWWSLGWLGACGPKGNQPNVEVIQDMMEQPALKAQDFHPHDREKSSMLVPPEGSWPRNVKPYLYKGDPGKAAKKLKNPNGRSPSVEVVQRGRQLFNNYCSVCHGTSGKGNGPVAAKWKSAVKIPSLVSKHEAHKHTDGHIFHIITEGQGLMGAYIYQVPREEDRWAIVSYVRQLQKKNEGP